MCKVKLGSTPWHWRALPSWSLRLACYCDDLVEDAALIARPICKVMLGSTPWHWRALLSWSLRLACYCDDLAEDALIARICCYICVGMEPLLG